MKKNDIAKLQSIMTDIKIKCSCGKLTYIPPNLDKRICQKCGKYVFKDKKTEFDYRLMEAKNRNEKKR